VQGRMTGGRSEEGPAGMRLAARPSRLERAPAQLARRWWIRTTLSFMSRFGPGPPSPIGRSRVGRGNDPRAAASAAAGPGGAEARQPQTIPNPERFYLKVRPARISRNRALTSLASTTSTPAGLCSIISVRSLIWVSINDLISCRCPGGRSRP